ncbi:hypothetical protein WA026_015035 [Henosepilachna vigintioctopunctata]|uniref:RNA helicase n=1 Tax=Henosepilachna vigintioctopunctata TaxID=420089 RepID=A0AAW1U978_9CUCU
MNKEMIAHNIDSENRTKDVIIEDNLTFQSMFLSEKVLGGLSSCGFRKPSPIQLKAIPVGRCGFDLIVKSKAGTGKTLVFSVIALEVINTDTNDLQVLILAPTREIAVQSADVINSIGKNIHNLKVSSFIGGLPEKEDKVKAQNCHIAVGAPGRIKSLIKQKILNVNSLKLFVMDEADKLMEKNFQNDLNEIYYSLPLKKQIIATSATFPEKLKGFLSNYMQSPTQINAEIDCPLLLGLKQYIKVIKPSSNNVQEMKNKNENLIQLLEAVSFTQCLIFSNYQTRVETVCTMLNNAGWKATFISGAQTQVKRLEVMNNLKNFKCRILLTTDLTARGIDAANVDLIINYDIPIDVMTYLHRMGRAGRYGSRGLCITLISGKKDIKTIQKYLGIIGGTSLTVAKLPEVLENQVDLWEMNTNKFEQITGIVEDDEDSRNLSVSVKTEIMNLKIKEIEKIKTDQKISDTVEENTDEDSSVGETSLKISEFPCASENELKTSEMEDESGELSDCKITLESMAKGIFDFESTEASSSKPPLENVNIRDLLSSRDKETEFSLNNQNNTLMSLAEGKFNFDSCDNSNKIFVEDNSTESIDDTKKTSMKDLGNHYESRNSILSKNKAVYEVAKLLSDEKEGIDSDMEENLNNYLKCLTGQNDIKEKFPLSGEISNIEVLNSDFQPSTSEKVVSKHDVVTYSRDDNLENIFVHAYKFAIDGEKHWKLSVPETELNKSYEDEHEESEVSAQYCENMALEDNEEDDDDCSGIEYNENGKRIYAYKDIPNRMVWVPCDESVLDSKNKYHQINLLESDDDSGENDENLNDTYQLMLNMPNEMSKINQSTEADQNRYTKTVNVIQSANNAEQLDSYSRKNSYRDQFASYFDQCSRELWEDGWRFDSVENFDNWFHQWQERVQDVRDYVSQNIYVMELGEYQIKKRKK